MVETRLKFKSKDSLEYAQLERNQIKQTESKIQLAIRQYNTEDFQIEHTKHSFLMRVIWQERKKNKKEYLHLEKIKIHNQTNIKEDE